MTTNTSGLLNDFIAILKDGLLFYGIARDEVRDRRLQDLFLRMIKLREKTILDLAPLINEDGSRVRVMATLVGTVHKDYTALAAKFGDPREVFLRELAALELRTLDALTQSIDDAPQGEVRSTLADHFNEYKLAHAELKNFRL